MIEISHTAADGSLLFGTYRSDGAGEILKPLGWRWSRNVDAWYLPRSRDKAPADDVLSRTAEQLRAEGYTVEISVDRAQRAADEVEQDRSERTRIRATTLTERAARAAAEAEVADGRARAISAHIPLGQPILIDHNSAPRHLRDLARIDSAHNAAAGARARSRELGRKAEAAAANRSGRFNPQVVARRIGALEVQTRKLERTLAGYTNHLRDVFPPAEGEHKLRIAAELDVAREQLEYWQGVRDEQIRRGDATNYSRADIDPGDQIKYRGSWLTVIRVNSKSVSVRSQAGGNWTDTIAYPEITDHRATAG